MWRQPSAKQRRAERGRRPEHTSIEQSPQGDGSCVPAKHFTEKNRRVESHEQGAIKGSRGGADELRYFCLTENGGLGSSPSRATKIRSIYQTKERN
jgi:hypothetical protein